MLPLISVWWIQLLLGTTLLAATLLLLNKIYLHFQLQLEAQKSLVQRINRVLPQTQCGRCGHPGCLPYARAMSRGEASNKCPPGGEETMRELARLLNEPATGLDPTHGEYREFRVAVIREVECIGCTKCIQACPVDAILGGPKLMHTVIEAECTGCDLCIDPCPVDCIDMIAPTVDSGPRLTGMGKTLGASA